VITEAGHVRWGVEPFVFELQSPDPEILARGEQIFGCWTVPENAIPTVSWTLVPDGHEFVIQPGIAKPDGGLLDRMRSAGAATIAIETGAVQAILDSPRDVLCVHGALVSRGGRGLLIVGPGHAGKSTLACALWTDGWSLLCDDVSMVVGREARPTPRRVSLRRESHSLIDAQVLARVKSTPGFAETTEGCLFQARQLDADAPKRTTLAAIVFLARRGVEVAGSEASPIPAAHAAVALLPYTNLARRLPFVSSLTIVSQLARDVPAYDVGRGPLPSMIQTVTALVERA
jgi:hypothetical protein